MLDPRFNLTSPRLSAADLERPSLKRAEELLAASDVVGADLVLRTHDRVLQAHDRLATRPDEGGALRAQIAAQRADSVRLLEATESLLRKNPHAPELRLTRAKSLRDLGRLDEALAGVRAARAAANASANALVRTSGRRARGNAGSTGSLHKVPTPEDALPLEAQRLEMQILIRARRLDEARVLLKEWATQPPMAMLVELHAGEIALLEGDAAAAHARLTSVLANERFPAMIRWNAAFHLVRACEKLGDFDGAFAAATAGNALPHPPFDADGFDRATDALIAKFDARFFAEAPISNIRDERPVFVVGLPRSGTSLLEQIIASHPRAGGVGERQLGDMITENLERLATVRRGLPMVDDLDHEARAYLDMFRMCGVDRERVVNKALGLERHLGWLSRVLPGMRVIRIDRDPRDCLLSIYQHPLSVTRYPWTCALDTLVRAHRDFTRLMDHWARTLQVPVLEVRYESLVERQAEETDRIIRFLGLEPDPACLRFHETKRVVLTPSQDQVREPMNRAGIGRWKRYEKHIGPLLEAFSTPTTRSDS